MEERFLTEKENQLTVLKRKRSWLEDVIKGKGIVIIIFEKMEEERSRGREIKDNRRF